jgi:hypothetical protein
LPKTRTIVVTYPSLSGGIKQTEFVFSKEQYDYVYNFGETKLVIFNPQKYFRQLRHIKQEAFAKVEDNQSTYEPTKPWTSLEKFP